jgi:hypothetical protein
MYEPQVTIGVPVYNGARHLELCLKSLLAQTYDDIEIVISDNASTNSTAEICRDFCERDERMRYYRQHRNNGAAANYNFLPRSTQGELFKCAGHDDFCAPEFVERRVAALDRSPTHVLALPRTVFVDDAGKTLSKLDIDMHWRNHLTAVRRLQDLLGRIVESLIHKCTPQFGVIRRTALDRTGLMGAYNSSDLVLLVELAPAGSQTGTSTSFSPASMMMLHSTQSALPSTWPSCTTRHAGTTTRWCGHGCSPASSERYSGRACRSVTWCCRGDTRSGGSPWTICAHDRRGDEAPSPGASTGRPSAGRMMGPARERLQDPVERVGSRPRIRHELATGPRAVVSAH